MSGTTITPTRSSTAASSNGSVVPVLVTTAAFFGASVFGTSAVTAPSSVHLDAKEHRDTQYAGEVDNANHEFFPDALRSLKDEADLTWEQMAKILGVERRSVHLWLNGRLAKRSNVQRVSDLGALFSAVQLPAKALHLALLSPGPSGKSAADLFHRRQDGEARELLKQKAQANMTAFGGKRPPVNKERVENLTSGSPWEQRLPEKLAGEFIDTLPLVDPTDG